MQAQLLNERKEAVVINVNKLLTLKEIAKELGVPESSLRKYREIFSAFIPSVGSGRSRRYREEAIEILNEIRNLREDMNLPWDAISEKLAEKYPMDGTMVPPAPEIAQSQQQQRQEPRQIQASAPSIKVSHEPVAGTAFVEKISAMNERQAMMLNAVAIELARSIEKTGSESKKDIDNLRMNVGRAMETLYHAMNLANRREESLLIDIQKRLDTLEKEVKTAGEMRRKNSELIAKMVKEPKEQVAQEKIAPKQTAPEVKAAANGEAKKVADMKRAIIIAREQIRKKDQALKDAAAALENLKRENQELKKTKQEAPHNLNIAREHSRLNPEEDGSYEPRNSSRQKKSFFSRKRGK